MTSGEDRCIAVFRALQLGDVLCAVPALRAIRAANPVASVTFIGLPWAREFVARFSHLVDDFIEFPGHPALPEREYDAAAWPEFLREVQNRQFDLAIQLHGSGGVTNPLVQLFGAQTTAGFYAPGEWVPDAERYLPWPEAHEIHALLALPVHLGMPAQGDHLEFPISEREVSAVLHVLAIDGIDPARLVCIHPGSRLQSRRWGEERFAEAGRALAGDGWHIAVTGTASERELAARVAAGIPGAQNLAGQTTLGEMAALIRQARLLISNDTGASHIAAATRTLSVIVASGSDVARWRPLDERLHRVLAHEVECRPCGFDACPVPGHPCAAGVSTAAGVAAARALLATRLPSTTA